MTQETQNQEVKRTLGDNTQMVKNPDGSLDVHIDSKIIEVIRQSRNTALELVNTISVLENIIMEFNRKVAIQAEVIERTSDLLVEERKNSERLSIENNALLDRNTELETLVKNLHVTTGSFEEDSNTIDHVADTVISKEGLDEVVKQVTGIVKKPESEGVDPSVLHVPTSEELERMFKESQEGTVVKAE